MQLFFADLKKAIIFAAQLGRLAQLVQSTCLTSRGSQVRTLYLPPKPHRNVRLFIYMIFLVYILFSKTLNKYYVGFTSEEITERLRKHNSNHKGFTGNVGDWEIEYLEPFDTKEEALKREKEINSYCKNRINL